ncbi:hypothetical protein [Helicobacter sp. T3_23-1059]
MIAQAQKRERERERESSSALNLSSSQKAICHTEALAEVSQNATKLCHTERSEVSLKNIDCHEFATFNKVANSRNDGNENSSNGKISTSLAGSQTSHSNSIADLQTSCPPSLAEGARGWVSLEVSKSPASLKNATLSLRALQRNAWQSTTKNAANDSSKADIAKADSNNAKSCNNTHPQTPSAREGALRSIATLSREGDFKAKNANTSHTDNICQTDKKAICHTEALAEVSQKATKLCHTERSEVSQNTQINRDISGFALNMTKFNRHCETSAGIRGNPQCKTNKIDCHADFVKSVRNDGNICHTERSEVSLKNIDCHEFATFNKVAKSRNDGVISPSLAEGARGWVNQTPASLKNATNDSNVGYTHPQTPSAREGVFKAKIQTTNPKKRLALSIATSAILASLSIDSLAAACSGAEDWSRGNANSNGIGYYYKVDCTGYTTADAVSSSARSMLNGGGYYRHSRLNLNGNVGDGTVTLQFSSNGWSDKVGFPASYTTRELRFNSTDAGRTTFNVSNSTTAATNVDIYSFGSTNVGGLTLSGGTIRNVNLSGGGRFGNITVNSGVTASNMSLQNGITVGYLSNSGTISNLTINGENANVGAISGGGTISTLTLGSANNHNALSNTNITNTVNTLLIYGASVTIASGSGWNTPNNNNKEQHITIAAGCSNASCMGVAQGSITIYMSEGVDRNTDYELKNLVVSGTTAIGTSLRKQHIALDAEDRSGRGTKLIFNSDNTSFRLEPDGGDAYIADVYRAIIMGNLRRNATTQNILDTMTTKTFHSDRYYNQEVDLRLLQYEMSRLTNRSSKFNKQKRKNERKIDKVREKIAKLTLDQSKGQDLDKGYNNFELIDQLDAIFIPYNGRKDWRFFALPYASHTYGFVGVNETQEFAGGAILGIQRNLRKNGIFGGYVGYEFADTNTYMQGSQTNIYNNGLQAGLNYYKSFAITAKVMEGFIKANIRASVDLPQFRFQAAGKLNTIDSNEKGIAIPLVASGGAELRGGVTFYNFKRNSYVAPEVSVSYDTFYGTKMRFDKPFIQQNESTKLYPIGGDEKYGSVLWHLPQVGISVRHYAIWGNTFRTNVKAGIKYNILDRQKLGSFTLAGQEDTNARYINLPKAYGNLAFDLIWMIKKNHELSLGYDGLFFATSFEKKNGLRTAEWFNGITTTVNLKYAYWFGGSDYVTDKDGNAVSRSIVEGSKKSKSKKSKKKKEKKSKKKVYYIDG